MKCPECGHESEGRFCAQCGASLGGARCAGCDAALPTGARYCTNCGRAVAALPARLPWLITAVALFALTLVLLWPALRERMAEEPAGGAPVAALGGGAPPPLTGTPREQADRLFNRVMNERAAGNESQARFFADMAARAYAMAEPLDHDGLFHLSLIEASRGDGSAALAAARRILEDSPVHLLGLAAAGEAAMMAGDSAAARDYFARFLDNYEAESAKQLPEYIDHGRVLPDYRSAAEALTGG